jgi:hypothetical protein
VIVAVLMSRMGCVCHKNCLSFAIMLLRQSGLATPDHIVISTA